MLTGTWDRSLTSDYPTLFYIILSCQLKGTWIHFILQLPNTCLTCRFFLINSTNYQTGVASLFLLSFPALCLQMYIFSPEAFPWVSVLQQEERSCTHMKGCEPGQGFHHGHPHPLTVAPKVPTILALPAISAHQGRQLWTASPP